MADDRARVWSFIVWEESAPEGWINYLQELHISGMISPFHDKDHDQDGKEKKPHWHILLNFSGKKTYAYVRDIAKSCGSDCPIRVADICAMTRYISSHIDNPDKAPYNKNDSICLGGFDLEAYFAMPKSLVKQYTNEMVEWIIQNNCTEFATLVEYAHFNNENWEYVLSCVHTNYFCQFLKSRNLRKKDKVHKIEVDQDGVIND